MKKKTLIDYEREGSPLCPPLSILVKLGSIAVHVEEFFSPDGHDYDRQTILASLEDPQLRQWLKEMDERSFLPVKRNNTAA